uniref:Nucleoside phosphorylase domain-containing protein n=1 Tax=Kalanchoe fedtschenkoi TaxID=63787 RepID=A0A7N0TXJ3_KALFE
MIVRLVKLVVLLITVHLQLSAQLRPSHPAHDAVRRVNGGIGGPYIGLLMAFPTEEMALVASGLFVPDGDIPWIELAGRRFNVGKIKGVDVIYVMSGELTILVDTFDIRGVVHYGIAGSSNSSLNIGDVSIMKYVAFTGSWKWKEYESEASGKVTELKFGDYDLPTKGENLLAKIKFTPQQLYTNGKPMQEVFWLAIELKWYEMAASLKDLELIQCLNETYCLPQKPKVVAGLRGATADIFVDNAAFRDFLFKKLYVSTVDEESSAVVLTCLSNGVPSVVFRGVSDTAGGGGGESRGLTGLSFYSLAAVNAFIVAVEFIALVGSVSDQNTASNI